MISLRNKLQRSLSYTSIIILSIIVFGFFYSLNTSLESNELKLVQNSLAIINQRVSDFDEINVASLEMFIYDVKKSIDSRGVIDVDHIELSIYEYDQLFKFGASMALGLEDGRMFSSHAELLPADYDPRVRPWYIEAINKKGNIHLSAPYITADVGKEDVYVVTYSKVVREEIGSPIGVAGLDIDMTRIFNLTEAFQLPKGSFTAIASSQGQILISDFYNLEDIQQIPIDTSALQGDLPLEITVDGTDYLAYATINQATKWITLVFVPKHHGYMRFIHTIVISCFLLFAFILLTRLFATRFSLRISKPLETVVEQMEVLNLSRVKYRLTPPKSDIKEVHVLTDGINRLLERLFDQQSDLQAKQVEIRNQYMEIEALYEETTAMNDTLNDTMAQLEDSWLQTIRVLSNAIEANDHYTKGHCDRVARLALAIGQRYGLPQTRLKTLEIAALLHDVGKVGIPDQILNKEGKLTKEEYELVKKHPEMGYKIIQDVPHLMEAATFILYHHERIDGNGYPAGLKDKDIQVESRILAVVDAYDAMTSVRSYRKTALTSLEAIEELKSHQDTQFDKEIVYLLVNALKADETL